MVGRKKKPKICNKVSHEDRISKLPDSLISEILSHLSTKDAVKTSVLSTRWKSLWQCVPALDFSCYSFRNFDAFVSFADRVLDSHRKSWIRKLRLNTDNVSNTELFITRWIDAVTTHRIQHLDVKSFHAYEIPQSLYTCKTLVHLQLYGTSFAVNTESVSLPCLKILHLGNLSDPNKAMLQKLISGSPVLEVLKIYSHSTDDGSVLQVCSQTVKRIQINLPTKVVIDAPLLQYLWIVLYSTKTFEIINLGISTKLDIVFSGCSDETFSSSVIHDILTGISRVRDLVISNHFWKDIFLYSKSGPVLQFGDPSRLDAKFTKSDLEMLPTILESCPNLESFILTVIVDLFMRHKKKEPKVMFSTVPRCLVSSLKFVELKRSKETWYEGEKELVRYLLKNATIMQTLKLDIYYPENAKCDFLQELLTMPRCSSTCEIHCSFNTEIFLICKE